MSDNEINVHDIFNKLTQGNLFEILFPNEYEHLLICGNNPSIYNFNKKNIFYFC